MGRFTRKEIKDRLYQKIREKKPIVMGGAGVGIIAKSIADAGIDFILAYSTGMFRMDGLLSTTGRLPYADSDACTVEIGSRIFRVVRDTPVICGVGGSNPNHDVEEWIDRMLAMGYSGVINVPMIGGISGPFRAYTDAVGTGYSAETDMVRMCNQKDIFTVAYAYSEDEVRRMVAAGVDIISPHMGLTGGGSIGAPKVMDLDAACERLQYLYEVAVSENPDVIVISHGGPFTTPDMVQVSYDKTDVHGFMGASSIERLPVETAVYDAVKNLTGMKTR